MIYRLSEGKEIYIKSYSSNVDIIVDNLTDIFTEEGKRKIIYENLKQNKCVSLLKIPKDLIDKLFECIIANANNSDILNILNQYNTPLFSIILNIVNQCKKNYAKLNSICEADNVYFECDKDNLLKILSLCENINCPIIIDGTKISLEEYKELLDKYDFNKLSNRNIKVYYQKYNEAINIFELYSISCQIDFIAKKIKKYNLSSFEQLILVYDIVKNNVYIKENDNDSPFTSRTLNNILNNDYIVCVGYVTMANAILKSLGNNVTSILCDNDTHCRGLIYINDKKYNIDGVYVFDPTFDNKKDNDSEYFIDNYNYFSLPYYIAEKSSHTELFDIFDLTIDELHEIFSGDDYDDQGVQDVKNFDFEQKLKKQLNICDDIKTIFSLIGSDRFDLFMDMFKDFDILDADGRHELETIYEDVISKYKVDDISIDIFISALYNTRRIEYYLDGDKLPDSCSSKLSYPELDDISIFNIKMAILERYSRIKYLSNKNRNNIIGIMETFDYENEIGSYISHNIGRILSVTSGVNIKRDALNMKLLKILKREKNQKEIDNN